MIDIILNYQAVAFTPSIEATSQRISEMMSLFADKGFVPTTQQEITLPNNDGITTPQLRFSLNSPKNEWVIHFGMGRIDISKRQTDAKGTNVGLVKDFSAEVSDTLVKILNKLNQKANRLGLSSNFILKEMAPQQLDSIFEKIFSPTQTYKDYKPFEWNYRAASRLSKPINQKDELVNFITSANRFSGQMNTSQSIVDLDRIAMNIDINTLPTNKQDRFAEADIRDYFDNVYQWHNNLVEEFTNMIK
jgi:hypothetical protein